MGDQNQLLRGSKYNLCWRRETSAEAVLAQHLWSMTIEGYDSTWIQWFMGLHLHKLVSLWHGSRPLAFSSFFCSKELVNTVGYLFQRFLRKKNKIKQKKRKRIFKKLAPMKNVVYFKFQNSSSSFVISKQSQGLVSWSTRITYTYMT